MDKIDLIIDALESAHHTNDTGVMGLTKLRLDTALAAARELRELEPVAWRVGGINFYTQDVAKAQSHAKKQPLFPLYALDGEQA